MLKNIKYYKVRSYPRGVQVSYGDGSRSSGAVAEAEAVALLLLSLAGFVVLEPVEHVLSFDLPKLAELSRDLLYLLRVRSAHSSPVQSLQYPYLFLRWIPPCPSRVRLNLRSHRKHHRTLILNFQKKTMLHSFQQKLSHAVIEYYIFTYIVIT